MVCVTDCERRDVARSLRRMAAKHDGVAGIILENRLGLESDERFLYGSVFTRESVERLADLIEPDTAKPVESGGLDRAALLNLAEDVDGVAEDSGGFKPLADMLHDIARTIRDACGVTEDD